MKKRLLKALRAAGFTQDNPTLEQIEAFIKDNDIVLDLGEGVTVKSVFEAKKTIVITDGADDDDNDTKSEDEDAPDEMAVLKTRLKALEAKSARGRDRDKLADVADESEEDDSQWSAGQLAKRPAKDWERMAARKSYNHLVKMGNTLPRDRAAICADADIAEVQSAAARLSLYEADVKGVKQFYPAEMLRRDRDIVAKSQTAGVMTAGGVLVKPQYMPGLMYATEDTGAALMLADVIQMDSDTAIVDRKTTIPTMVAIAELATVTTGDMAFDQVRLVCRDVGYISQVSNRLFRDASLSWGDEFTRTATEARNRCIDKDFFLGDGSATYNNNVGLANSFGAAPLPFPSGSGLTLVGTTYATVTAGDLLKGPGSVTNVVESRCQFAMPRQAFYQSAVRLSQVTAKGSTDITAKKTGAMTAEINGIPTILVQGQNAAGTQNISVAGTTGTVFGYYGDFKGSCKIGLREGLKVASSEHAGFTTDSIYFRATTAYAITIHGDGRSSTIGNAVKLTLA